jgi:purine-cytosine permease-like protein
MVLFTAVMTWDIFGFGQKMRNTYLHDAFGTQGKIVLLLLGVLLCLGWFLVGRPDTLRA